MDCAKSAWDWLYSIVLIEFIYLTPLFLIKPLYACSCGLINKLSVSSSSKQQKTFYKEFESYISSLPRLIACCPSSFGWCISRHIAAAAVNKWYKMKISAGLCVTATHKCILLRRKQNNNPHKSVTAEISLNFTLVDI